MSGGQSWQTQTMNIGAAMTGCGCLLILLALFGVVALALVA